MDRSMNRVRGAVALGASVLVGAAMSASGGGVAAAPATTPPDAGAEASSWPATPWAVVAQRVDHDLPQGQAQWVVAEPEIASGQDPISLDDERDLLAVRAGELVILNEGETRLRLNSAEVAFVDDDDEAVALGEEPAVAVAIAVRPAADPGEGGTPIGEPFASDAQPRDVEARLATVAPDDTVDVAVGETPVLLVAISGDLSVDTSGGVPATPAGKVGGPATTVAPPPTPAPAEFAVPGVRTVTETTTFVNHGDVPAVVLAVTMGDPVLVDIAPAAPPAATTTTAAPTTVPETTVADDGDTDADGDGLTLNEELDLGTDPDNEDTDGDLIPDGEEVHAYGTDPLRSDTDEDGVDDYTEIDLGISPHNADNDGDFLFDGDELHVYGTDPDHWDTDGDGVWDGEEVDVGTNPLDPASF